MNLPTVFNPQYSAEMRKSANALLVCADLLDKAAGISPNATSPTPTRTMSESTKRKIRASHLKRAKVHEIGKAA